MGKPRKHKGKRVTAGVVGAEPYRTASGRDSLVRVEFALNEAVHGMAPWARSQHTWRGVLAAEAPSLASVDALEMDYVVALWEICAHLALDVLSRRGRKAKLDAPWTRFTVLRCGGRGDAGRAADCGVVRSVVMDASVLRVVVMHELERRLTDGCPPLSMSWNVHALLRQLMHDQVSRALGADACGVPSDAASRLMNLACMSHSRCVCGAMDAWRHGDAGVPEAVHNFVHALWRAHYGERPVDPWHEPMTASEPRLTTPEEREAKCAELLQWLLWTAWPSGTRAVLVYRVRKVYCVREADGYMHTRVVPYKGPCRGAPFGTTEEGRMQFIRLVEDHVPVRENYAVPQAESTELLCQVAFLDEASAPSLPCRACTDAGVDAYQGAACWRTCGALERAARMRMDRCLDDATDASASLAEAHSLSVDRVILPPVVQYAESPGALRGEPEMAVHAKSLIEPSGYRLLA